MSIPERESEWSQIAQMTRIAQSTAKERRTFQEEAIAALASVKSVLSVQSVTDYFNGLGMPGTERNDKARRAELTGAFVFTSDE